MRGRMFRMVCSAVIVLMVAVISMSVQGSEPDAVRYNEAYYDELEDAYLTDVHDALDTLGLKSAGTNLTKVTTAQGCRSYKLVVYSKSFHDKAKFDQVLSLLSDMSFPDEACGVAVFLCES